MTTPKISRPKFPRGYVDNPVSYVDWSWVAAQLTDSKHYWLCSVRPDGRPHVIPRWAVYIDGKIYYDGSPETRHAQNIVLNPNISVNLESGDHVIILEGTTAPAGKPTSELDSKLVAAYRKNMLQADIRPIPINGMKVDCICSRRSSASHGRLLQKTQPSSRLSRSWK